MSKLVSLLLFLVVLELQFIFPVSNITKVGTVWINCWMLRDLNMPFGGMKASGTGRESAHVSCSDPYSILTPPLPPPPPPPPPSPRLNKCLVVLLW